MRAFRTASSKTLIALTVLSGAAPNALAQANAPISSEVTLRQLSQKDTERALIAHSHQLVGTRLYLNFNETIFEARYDTANFIAHGPFIKDRRTCLEPQTSVKAGQRESGGQLIVQLTEAEAAAFRTEATRCVVVFSPGLKTNPKPPVAVAFSK